MTLSWKNLDSEIQSATLGTNEVGEKEGGEN